MARKAPQLAKLTRPRLHRAVPRERLFALLDEAREHKPAICVVGPPGAGKTTLVASWLDARSIKGIWYQVDPGDADLATFFYYLGEAAKPFTRKGQRPLPLLTPEYLHDVEGFSRRFFRRLLSRPPEGATLVLDNYQEVPAEKRFHELIAGAVAEVPPGLTLICVSRRDPPDCYARLRANERVALIEWEDLKLTLEEACAIGQLRYQLSRDEIARLHERSEGWAAGLVLLLERLKRGKGIDAVSTESLREVFNYFAAQLVEQFDVAAQKALLQMSYLPRMSAPMAVAITGTPSAAGLLEELHRRHLFTDCRTAHEPVFQFHALFQAFLKHRALQALTSQEQRQAGLHAARLLEEGGHPEEAFPLALGVGDEQAAVNIVQRHAARFIAQGRWRVVVDWVEAVPQEAVARNCWLLHWQGTALLEVDPPKARAILEKSFGFAEETHDALCQMQAAAGIIQTYMFEYTHFQPMDYWIQMLQRGLNDRINYPSADVELRAQAALLIALAYRQPSSPVLQRCLDRVFVLIGSSVDANLKVMGASYILAYGATTGPLEVSHRALPLLESLLQSADVTTFNRAWSRFIISWYYCLCAEFTRAHEGVSQLERMADEEGLPFVRKYGVVIGLWSELYAHKLQSGQQWLERLEKTISWSHPYDLATWHGSKAWLAFLSCDPQKTIEHGLKAVTLFDQAGSMMHRVQYRLNLVLAFLISKQYAEALIWIKDVRAIAGNSLTFRHRAALLMIESLIAIQQGDRDRGLALLRGSLLDAKQHREDFFFSHWLRPWMHILCTQALVNGIEVEFVRNLIRRYGYPAPRATVIDWPWSMRICTLGKFQVVVDDKALSFTRKTPRRPIALLKAIVAMGGKEVPSKKLVDALWPELEGDAGDEAFNQALHRLRRLLGSGEAVLLEDGKVSLNEALVWTDVRAFEESLGQEQPNGDHEALFKLYRGQFLAEEADAAWAVSLRERLRSKFVHKVEQAGLQLEADQRWREAIALYLRGLDADSLNEAFYQGLMRCYASLDNRAEAISVYRRLREQLSIVLGMKPSSSSEALARELRLQ